MENMKINWKLLQKAKNPRSQQEIGCREIENILKTAEKSWNFRWKLQNRTAGESKPSPNHPTKKSNRLKTVGHLYKMRFKNDTSILLFLHDTTKKKPMTSFLSWAYGGKKGIRTLEGFRGPTRFPVVRLRPAQPSFHFLCCIVDFSIHDQFCDNRGNTISCFRFPHDCLDIIPAISEKVKSFF